MCNIAGYVGNRDAAPILIEMIRKQEGLAGGFYTGIATIHEGKIYHAKLTGDLDRLLSLTEAAKLPGKIGIIHSRSRSGGGDKWSHPFMHYDADGLATEAYVANGSAGIFNEKFNARENSKRIAQELADNGYPMPDRDKVEDNIYTTLEDGMAVHMSDVMCQLIARNIAEGDDSALAMKNAFCEMPAEIVGLLLSPDAISYSRFNFPMSVAFSSHGAYLASASFAIPSDAGAHAILPASSYGKVYADHFETFMMKDPPLEVGEIDISTASEIYPVIYQMLKSEPRRIKELRMKVSELLPDAPLKQPYVIVYEMLGALLKRGELLQITKRVESDFEGIDAPRFFYQIKA